MPNKPFLITIAGPQSSGKSTVFSSLQSIYPTAFFIEETNQYKLIGNHHPGAAYVTSSIEEQILNEDIKIINSLDCSQDIYIIETGILHVTYAAFMLGKEKADIFFNEYLRTYNKFRPVVLFIDTKPEISWKRRKPIYFKRTADCKSPQERTEMMNTYRKRIIDLYTFWLQYYQRIPFTKFTIRNSYKRYDTFMKEVLSLMKTFVEPLNILDMTPTLFPLP